MSIACGFSRIALDEATKPNRSLPRARERIHSFAAFRSRVIAIGYRAANSPNACFACCLSQSRSAFTKAETFSARNDRTDTARCSESSNCVSGRSRTISTTRPAAYSLSVSLDEMNISQSGNCRFTASSHASIPASPVLISCPPPTKQTITAQSLCLSIYEIRNSGSE